MEYIQFYIEYFWSKVIKLGTWLRSLAGVR